MCGQTTQTRRESYEAAKPKFAGVQSRILDFIERVGTGSPTQVADALDESILTVRPAFTRLKQAGALQETGLRFETEAGKNEVVYRLNPYWDGTAAPKKAKKTSTLSEDRMAEVLKELGVDANQVMSELYWGAQAEGSDYWEGVYNKLGGE